MFSKPTVDGILADFTKKITQLETLYDVHDKEIAKNTTKIAQLDATNHGLAKEMGRANTVKDKLKELIGA